jgi:hypothetical protein
MAGAEGFEPPKAVLETAGLPLAYAPQSNGQRSRASYQSTEKNELLSPGRFLFDLFMRMMLAAERTELAQLQPARRGLFIFHAGVVLVFAFTTLQCNLFPRHCIFLLFQNLADGASAHGASALANCEAQALGHGDRRMQFHH